VSYLIGDTRSLRGVVLASDADVVYAALKRRENRVCSVRRGVNLMCGAFPCGVRRPEEGIVRATSAPRIKHLGDGLIDVQVATLEHPVLQLLGDRDQKVRAVVNDAVESLTRMSKPFRRLMLHGTHDDVAIDVCSSRDAQGSAWKIPGWNSLPIQCDIECTRDHRLGEHGMLNVCIEVARLQPIPNRLKWRS
jgi:hypothetical protein